MPKVKLVLTAQLQVTLDKSEQGGGASGTAWQQRGSLGKSAVLRSAEPTGETTASGAFPRTGTGGKPRQTPRMGRAFGKSNRYPDFSPLRNHLWSG